ncbi:BURP domain-containing protein [Prunus dulcis]|uniref:BURP domain-containing protein n=1 Tax=Prunus dulcis TaxID=3755 RepID=A0A4Y1RLS4_PRUDU|nr:BURP domain-containing protein [Prunus dulcis]
MVEMGSNVELVWPEAEAYSSRVNNCSHANSSLAAIRAKLSAEQLEQFKTSCFGHLLNIDKIQFSGQIVHGAVLRRVAGRFTRQDFCLITGLRFGEVPEVSSGESDEIRLQERYFIDDGITCNALEEAFLRCTEEDDIYKLALVYFAELVVLGRDKHLNINLNYLTLVEDLDAFNRYPWGSVSFDKTQDSLFSAPTKYVKSFENEEGRGKGKSKVTGTSRRNEKGKKDKHGEAQRSGWSFKGFTYAFQIWVYELIPRMADLNYCKVVDPTAVPRILRWRTTTSVPEMRKLNNYFFQSKESVQLRPLCPSEEEMRQPYWSWPQDRPAVVLAESIPSSCGDLDELNKVVSFLRSELFQVKREKDILHLKVIRMEKLLDRCLGPQFEQEVRRDLALLKQRTNRCVVSHLFKDMGNWMTYFNRMKGQVTEMRGRKRKMKD